MPGAATDRIDARAAGPFRLPEPERARLRGQVDALAACLRGEGQRTTVAVAPSGRPYLLREGGPASPEPSPSVPGRPRQPVGNGPSAPPEVFAVATTPIPATPTPEGPRQPRPAPSIPTSAPPSVATPSSAPGQGTRVEPSAPPVRPAPTDPSGSCPSDAPGPTATEKRALDQLSGLVRQCQGSRVELWLDETGTPTAPASAAECLATARRAQLKSYVAPAALLYIGSPDDRAPGIDPYGIAGVTAVILVLAVGGSVLIATRLMRPVREVTGAARRMRAGDGSARVTVRAKGDVGELGAAFNEMSEHLDLMERQRKAMVSDVSHELRTPLSNIRGWLEAAQDGVAELDPALTASLVEEATLLQHIVDDLQQLALADVGKLRLHPELVDVADLAEQIATVYRAAAEAAGLALTVEVTGRPSLDADPVRLRQAVGNLLANAVRYTPAGGRVSLRASADGDAVLIEVADTGPGIAPEHLPHVFDRFWRAEKSRNRQTGGSGLGLAIVRQLAEAHGGSAAVHSEPGGGATFVLRLPRPPDDDAP